MQFRIEFRNAATRLSHLTWPGTVETATAYARLMLEKQPAATAAIITDESQMVVAILTKPASTKDGSSG